MVKKYVLFDVDGTLIDAVDNQRRVWHAWAQRYGLAPEEVHAVALRTRPLETFAQVAADRDPQECLAVLHELEDEDVRSGVYAAFDGAAALLQALPSAERLGAEPDDCLVVEDAPSGVLSGLRAGMTVWGVNAPAAVDGVHRHFGSLGEAAGAVLAFARGADSRLRPDVPAAAE